MPGTTPSQKDSIRKEFISKRQSLSPASRETAAIFAAENFMLYIDKQLQIIRNCNIALYYPIMDELSPLPLIQTISTKLHEALCLLPVITAKQQPLQFYPYKIGDELVTNHLFTKLLEPNYQSSKIEPVMPDIVLVPLVAFDKNQHRLGYGAGFYDLTINLLKKNNANLITIGYGFELQKYPYDLPTSDLDARLDAVITETNIYN